MNLHWSSPDNDLPRFPPSRPYSPDPLSPPPSDPSDVEAQALARLALAKKGAAA